jgi:hypothetical protein
MREYTRGEWLALSPSVYLADGYLDDKGALREDFLADYVTAASMRLMAAEVSAHELAFVFEALRLLLPDYEGPPKKRLIGALTEAFEIVARAIRRKINEEIAEWLNLCATAVTTEAELAAFLAHVQAVTRRYSLIATMSPESSASSSAH